MKPSTVTRDYKEKKVFVGIDVHKRTYSLVAICEEVIVKTRSRSFSLNGFGLAL